MNEQLELKPNPIALSVADRAKIQTLIRASHRDPMDLEKILPWDHGIDYSKLPKMEAASWIYGTKHWDNLTAEQRHEVLWLEVARDVSMFIWLEQMLPPLYVNIANAHPFSLQPEVYEYLMIFSREEITHTLMFRRFLDTANLKIFRPPTGQYAQLMAQLPTMHPVVGILATLMVEWVAELNVMYLTQGKNNEPFVRKMFHEHHIEEVRHIAFGKRIVENFMATAPVEVKNNIRSKFGTMYKNLKAEVTYNREIALHTSFDFPIHPDNAAEIECVRNSENNQRLNEARFAEVDQWFRQLEIA